MNKDGRLSKEELINGYSI